MQINEIVENKKKFLPFDSSWLEKYHINDIAESLVARCDKNNSGRSNFFFNNTKLVMHFPSSAISNIIRTREFLNAHQVNYQSQGSTGKERAIVEAEFLNFTPDKFVGTEFHFNDTDKRIHYLRPKYSFCILDSSSTTSYSFFKKLCIHVNKRQYGLFSAVLDNELKSRSTFTSFDSSLSTETFSFYTNRRDITPYECQIFGEIRVEHVLYFQTTWEAELFEKDKIEELKTLKIKILDHQNQVLFDPQNQITLQQ